jgi:hypothetical protein
MRSVLALSIADGFIVVSSFHHHLEDAVGRIEFGEEMTLLDRTGEYSSAIIGISDCGCSVEWHNVESSRHGSHHHSEDLINEITISSIRA